MAPKTVFTLPDVVVTVGDLSRAKMELESLADFLVQSRIRKPGQAITLPRISRRLEALAHAAGLKLTVQADIDALQDVLANLKKTAPQLHISFASEPSDAFLTKLIQWFRSNIHPQVMLTIGLQPSITAGFILRTSSREFDCSLRGRFTDSKSLLIEALNNRQAATKVAVKAVA